MRAGCRAAPRCVSYTVRSAQVAVYIHTYYVHTYMAHTSPCAVLCGTSAACRVVASTSGSGPIILACPHLSLASLMHRRPSGRPLAAVPLFQGLLGPLVQILLAPPTTSASYLAHRKAAASQRRVPSHRCPSAHPSWSSAPASRPLCSTPPTLQRDLCDDGSLTRPDSHLPNTARPSTSLPAPQLNTSIPATTRPRVNHEPLSSSHWPACGCPEPAPQRAARPDPRRVRHRVQPQRRL